MLLTDSYLQYLLYEKNYAQSTVDVYQSAVLELQKYGEEKRGEVTLQTVDADLIRDWILSMIDQGDSPSTVNKKLSALRTYFKYLQKKKIIEVNPLLKVVAPKKRKKLPVFLKEKDMDRLLDDVNFDEGFEGCRDRLIIEMFYVTGMRSLELIGLRDVDVDLFACQLKVTGKRNKQRLIPFDEELKHSIIRYVNLRNEVFSGGILSFFVTKSGKPLCYRVVREIVKRNLSKVVTVKKRSPHVLRHTFATTMLNHGADLVAVKELLGHESLATTQVYTHATFEELKKVYNQAHPRA